MLDFVLQQAFIRRYANTARSPCLRRISWVVSTFLSSSVPPVQCRCGLDILMRIASANKATDEPSLAQIVTVHDCTAAQLDPLSRPVDPGKVDVERRLYETKHDTNRVVVLISNGTHEPIEKIECAVGAQSGEVEGINDGGYASLTQKEELGNDASRLEDK